MVFDSGLTGHKGWTASCFSWLFAWFIKPSPFLCSFATYSLYVALGSPWLSCRLVTMRRELVLCSLLGTFTTSCYVIGISLITVNFNMLSIMFTTGKHLKQLLILLSCDDGGLLFMFSLARRLAICYEVWDIHGWAVNQRGWEKNFYIVYWWYLLSIFCYLTSV